MPLKLHNLDLNMMSFKFESSNRADFFRWTSCASLVGRLSVRAGLFAGQRWIYSGKLWFFMSVEPQIHLIWPIEVQFSYPYVKGWFHKPWIQDPPTGPFRISCFFFSSSGWIKLVIDSTFSVINFSHGIFVDQGEPLLRKKRGEELMGWRHIYGQKPEVSEWVQRI